MTRAGRLLCAGGAARSRRRRPLMLEAAAVGTTTAAADNDWAILFWHFFFSSFQELKCQGSRKTFDVFGARKATEGRREAGERSVKMQCRHYPAKYLPGTTVSPSASAAFGYNQRVSARREMMRCQLSIWQLPPPVSSHSHRTAVKSWRERELAKTSSI